MVLNLFLVAAKLHLCFVQGHINGLKKLITLFMGYKVVLVFRLDQKLNMKPILLMVHGDLDHREAIKKVGKFFCLGLDVVLRFF